MGAAHQFGDEVRRVVVDGRLVQGHDRRVREPGRRARLALEPSTDDPLARHLLDRDLSVEPLVVRQPHGPETPCTKPL